MFVVFKQTYLWVFRAAEDIYQWYFVSASWPIYYTMDQRRRDSVHQFWVRKGIRVVVSGNWDNERGKKNSAGAEHKTNETEIKFIWLEWNGEVAEETDERDEVGREIMMLQVTYKRSQPFWVDGTKSVHTGDNKIIAGQDWNYLPFCWEDRNEGIQLNKYIKYLKYARLCDRTQPYKEK